MAEYKREYENAIIQVAYEFIVTYCNKNIPKHVIGDRSELRQFIGDFLTVYDKKVPDSVNEKMDIILQYELSGNKITNASNLNKTNNISLWKGDITTLYVDCIVNAANSKGTGCYIPGHKCIDNIIHSKAGPRMRQDCKTILSRYNQKEITTGNLITTLGYNLPSRYVFHVVGPIYDEHSEEDNKLLLIKCYINCLNRVRDIKKRAIAFCCISTGEYKYPKKEACIIAVNSVRRWMIENSDYPIHVIFCVYQKDDDNMGFYKQMV